MFTIMYNFSIIMYKNIGISDKIFYYLILFVKFYTKNVALLQNNIISLQKSCF